MTKYIAYALILMCQTTCNKSGVRFGRVKMGCGRIDKLDAEQCSRGWRYESCHHFRLENSIYFPGREIVGNAQRNVLMLSLTFQRQQHTAPPATTPCPLQRSTTTTTTKDFIKRCQKNGEIWSWVFLRKDFGDSLPPKISTKLPRAILNSL